jgi:hypothetical protein
MHTLPPVQDAGDLQSLLIRLEELRNHIDVCQAETAHMLDALKAECDQVIASTREQVHRSFILREQQGYDPVPDVPISDRRLKATWIALYRHHTGVTADVIASEIQRHRTTVSTSLNTLVQEHWAVKERHGHQILYRAVMKPNKDVSV